MNFKKLIMGLGKPNLQEIQETIEQETDKIKALLNLERNSSTSQLWEKYFQLEKKLNDAHSLFQKSVEDIQSAVNLKLEEEIQTKASQIIKIQISEGVTESAMSFLLELISEKIAEENNNKSLNAEYKEKNTLYLEN